MPRVYLSPSLQEYNLVIVGGTEEEWANRVVDAMEPYLYATGIEFTRNDPSMTLIEAINQSNMGNYDFHLAIHSNAAPESLVGILRGPDIYYYLGSYYGQEMARIIANNFARIYPNPADIATVPTVTLAELRRTRAAAVLVEMAYHDNEQDAIWMTENIHAIARELSRSLAEYFGIPFVEPTII